MREASPYIRAHRGHAFVVQMGGEAVDDSRFPHLIQDLALLCGVGIKLVVVHGTRPQIEQRLRAAKLASKLAGHLRVTDAQTLSLVKDATAAVRYHIEAQFAHCTSNRLLGGAPIRIAGGNFVVARPAGVINGIDLQFTGEIRKIDVAAINRQLDHGDLVLISPLGYSPTGEVFSLNALDLATVIAGELKASKLLVLGESPGILDAQGALLRQLTAREARELPPADESLRQVLGSAVKACQFGVERVHVVDRKIDGALLLELFTRDGIGTMISDTPFDQLRRATINDVGGILELIEPLETEGVLVKRSREKLEMEIDHFYVLVRDGATVACGALYPYVEQRMGEIACVAVAEDYRNNGFGEALIVALEHRALELGLAEVFVLTTQTAHWFHEHGYLRSGIASLPLEKRQLYNFQRNSVVLLKTLQATRP